MQRLKIYCKFKAQCSQRTQLLDPYMFSVENIKKEDEREMNYTRDGDLPHINGS